MSNGDFFRSCEIQYSLKVGLIQSTEKINFLKKHIFFPHQTYWHIFVHYLVISLFYLEKLAVTLSINRSCSSWSRLLWNGFSKNFSFLVSHCLLKTLLYYCLSFLVDDFLFVCDLHRHSSTHQDVEFVGSITNLIKVLIFVKLCVIQMFAELLECFFALSF